MRDYYTDITAEDIRACLRYATALVASEDVDLASLASNETELNAMRVASKDEMFLADLDEGMQDFHDVDTEGAPA